MAVYSVAINQELKEQFVKYCKERGLKQTSVIEGLIKKELGA